MALAEINFDGFFGPTHNYAGLSFGNLAATAHAGQTSRPRDAALQGLAKMCHNLALDLPQGFLLPLPRPNVNFLNALNAGSDPDGHLVAAAWSAASMWTANAATVSPGPDTADGRCHLTPANLVSMPHRSHEWPDTARQLALAFADSRHFALHAPIPPTFGDEGAANHLRLCGSHGEPGIELFVYGRTGGRFPARQHEQASRAVARGHGLDPARVLFIEQNPDAIAAGAFHSDVVAVANERVLFCHERAFSAADDVYAAIHARMPQVEIISVREAEVSLADAVASYLFNAQLFTLPSRAQALIVPFECCNTPSVSAYLERLVAGNGAIQKVLPVDVRQSMANGGGPACLRLRVVADPATVDPRFLLNAAKAQAIERVIDQMWPEEIAIADLGSATLTATVNAARRALLAALDLECLA
ncbi:MAG: N-succinylarginine dihydrolase [Novosphingobium sp.]